MGSQLKKRYLYEITFVRAIACLLVVMVHVGVRFYYAYDGNHTVLTNFLNQISRVGTPLFAVLSGFLLYNQALNRGFNLSTFIKSRLVKILLPFIFWSFFYLIYKSYFRNYSFPNFSSKKELLDFMYMFLTGGSHYHLYFIVLVIQFYLLFLVIRNVSKLKTIIIMMICSLYLNYTFVTNKFILGNSYLTKFINSRAFLLEWIYYFMLGILFVKLWPKIHEYLIRNNNSRYMILVGGIILFLTIFDYQTHQMIINSNQNLLYFINVPIVFLVLVSLYYQLIQINVAIVKALIYAGNFSMGIYFLHPFVIYLYQDTLPFDVTAQSWLIFPYFIAVVAICMFILKAMSYIPFYEYIITIVKTRKEHLDASMSSTYRLLKDNNAQTSQPLVNKHIENIYRSK